MNDLTPERREELARTIWKTSRADESTISATGANVVADALAPLIAGWLAAEREAGAAEVRAKVEAAVAMSDHEPTNRVWHEQMQRVRAALETP